MSADPRQPLRIDSVEVPGVGGRLGLCGVPGFRGGATQESETGEWLQQDLAAIRDFGAAGVVTLIDERELVLLGIDSMPVELRDAGLWWRHLPITDMGIPNRLFETRWEAEAPAIRDTLARGRHVVIHCWAGLGRTGTIAARLLVEFGMEPAAAILRVRDARPGSIQTRRQEKYVLRLRPPRRA